MPSRRQAWIPRNRQAVAAAIAALLVGSLIGPARAGDGGQDRLAAPGRSPASAADVALWREECGACHVAYPARLLPADAWREVMRSLDRHFGTDASLDAATAARIDAVLAGSGAARRATVPKGELPRITKQPWFIREHGEIAAATWKDKRVGGAVRCEACHADVGRGGFDERNLRRLP